MPRDKTPPFNPKTFMKGISAVESGGGKYMRNATSSASGLYQQLYNDIPAEYLKGRNIKSRSAFIADTSAQNDYMRRTISGNMRDTPRKTNLYRDAQDLEREYKPQLGDQYNYRLDEIAALSHFMGRQGARNYLGGIRDDKPYTPPGVNKTPEEYLSIYNEAIGDQTLPGRASIDIMGNKKKLQSELPELGLGDFIKDNTQGIIGGLKTVGGIALMATGAGAAIGAPLVASGISDIGAEITGDIAQKNADTLDQELIDSQKMSTYVNSKTQQLTADANQNSNFGKDMINREYGGFINYTGQKHSGPNGGIPVDEQGNPVATSGKQAVAKTEEGEVSWVKPDGTAYVFSEELGHASDAKKIMSRYKIRLGKDFDGDDSLARQGMTQELTALQMKQENDKMEQGISDDTPELQFGGDPGSDKRSATLGNFQGLTPVDQLGLEPYGQIADLPTTTPATQSVIGDVALQQSVFDNKNNQYQGFGVAGQSLAEITPDTIPSDLTASSLAEPVGSFTPSAQPYDPAKGTMIAAGISGALTAAGNLAQAFGRKKPEDISPTLVSPESVSFSEQRIADQSRASETKAGLRQTARRAGLSKAAEVATTGIGSAAIDRNLGEQNAKMTSQENQINAQFRTQASVYNQQNVAGTKQVNALRQDRFNQETNQYVNAAFGSVQGATGDMLRARQSANYLGMLGGRTGYQQVKDPQTGKIVLAPVEGFYEKYNS